MVSPAKFVALCLLVWQKHRFSTLGLRVIAIWRTADDHSPTAHVRVFYFVLGVLEFKMAKEQLERTKPHCNVGTIGHIDQW